jgi:hypothetical protein
MDALIDALVTIGNNDIVAKECEPNNMPLHFEAWMVRRTLYALALYHSAKQEREAMKNKGK